MAVHDDAPLLRTFLAEQDVPCPTCRSNLRGLTAEACPECGSPLRLSVSTDGPRLGPWVVVFLAASVPLGFVGVLGVLAIVATLKSPVRSAAELRDALFLGVATACLAGAMWFVVRRRGRFLSRPRYEQYARALAATITFGMVTLVILDVWTRLGD